MTEKANDVIFVGNKPPMSYVLAIIARLSAANLKEITLKARGQAITTAVDVAQSQETGSSKTLKLARLLSEQSRCHLVRERASPEWFQRWR